MKYCKILSLIVVLAILLPCLFVNVDASSVYKRQKKSIYLVLDDSGSMSGTNEYDANYSLQSLLAMTDKEDSVKIYFLNGNPFAFPKINMQKKDNGMLADVKDKYPMASGGTPYDKVKAAQQDLKDSVYEGDETEYWLVIFTDGEFAYDVSRDISDFASETLANGTKPNVLYITASGGNALAENASIPNLHSVNRPGVIEAMNEASIIITGRVNATGLNYSQNNTTVSFGLPYPAKNIVVFTQNKKTKVLNASAASTLNTSENYTVSYPVEYNIHNLNDSTVCFITEANGSSIGMGQVTLTFDQALSAENTTILYEPAIGISARYYREGQEIDPQSICKGDQIRVEFSICDSETKQPIDNSVLGGNIIYSANVNGQQYNNTQQVDFEVNVNEVKMSLYAALPDGFVLDAYNEYNNLSERISVNFSLSNGGRFKSDFDKLGEAEGVKANILVNGSPITPEKTKDFELIVNGENWISSKFKIEVNESEGGFTILPQKGGIIGVFTPENKTYQVELTDANGVVYYADLIVEIPGARPWFEIVLMLVGVLVIAYLIWVLATKKWFPIGTQFRYYQDTLPTAEDPISPLRRYSLFTAYFNELTHKPGTFLKHALQQLLPNTPMKITICGFYDDVFGHITIEANGPNSFNVTAKKEGDQDPDSIELPFVIYDTSLSTVDPTSIIIQDEKRHIASCDMGYYINIYKNSTDHYILVTTKRHAERVGID